MIEVEKHKHTYMTIPIELCFLIVNERIFRAAQVYICLKSFCDGKLRITPNILKEIAKTLEVKALHTIRTAIAKLIELDWVGYNPKSKYYFIRSYSTVCNFYEFGRKTVVKFEINYLIQLKAFLIAAIIEDLIRKQKRKLKYSNKSEKLKRMTLRAERIKGHSFQPEDKFASFYPLANLALAKILNISIQTAFEFKKLAKKHGFIEIKKNFEAINVTHSELWLYKKSLSTKEAAKIRKIKGSNGRYIIYKQECDTVKSNVIFAYGKKIKSLIRV